MNIYIIRHAEPDYDVDSLTAKGWREAELLCARLVKLPKGAYYVSPLGRARDTASLTTRALGVEPQVLPWLREFNVGYAVPPSYKPNGLGWDFLPESWVEDPAYYSPDAWFQAPAYRDSGILEPYRAVVQGLDTLLAGHGYARRGMSYQVMHANTDSIYLFCHFGVECVLLSRLLNISPVVLWHQTVAQTSSVTMLTTEERRPGTAVFRMSRFGDLSHLDGAGEAPSFFARFCEVNGDGTRED